VSRVHDERAEHAVEAARERAREKLRVLQLVLVHWTEGLTSSESAARLEVEAVTVRKYRGVLGLARGNREAGSGLRRRAHV
jgi:hypothetical protein